MDISILEEKPEKVRENEEMMRSYIELYKSVFHKEPNCASCSFSNDFRRLQNYFKQHHKEQVMSNSKKYKLNARHKDEMLRYAKDGKTYRLYGRDINDDFAKAYLKHGKKSELKNRADKFDHIPKNKKKTKEVDERQSEINTAVQSKNQI